MPFKNLKMILAKQNLDSNLYKKDSIFFINLTIIFMSCVLLISCSSGPKYIQDSKAYSSFEIDYHDIESVITKNTKSFMKSNFMQKHNKNRKAIIAISNITNQTGEDIDVELLSRKLVRSLSNYEQIILTNAVAGSGSSADKLIEDSRKLTQNENFNQYTTKEKGTLLSPEYSLSGKIVKQIRNIGKKQRVDYQFLFTLNDLDSGVEVWSNDVIIMKAINKEQTTNYTTKDIESKEASMYSNEAWRAFNAQKYSRAKSLFKKACKLGDSKSCADINSVDEAKREARIAKSYYGDSIFGGIIGADIGFGGGNVNMPHTPYTYTGTDYPNVGKDVTMNIFIKDIETDVGVFPYMLRIGGFYKQNKGLYLESNFLYRGYNTSFHSFELDCSESGSSYCILSDANIQGVDFKYSQIGGNLRAGYAYTFNEVNLALIGYVGGGVLFDVGSSVIIKGGHNVIKQADNVYPFWEAGVYLTFNDYFFGEVGLRYVFESGLDKYWIQTTTFNLGIGVFLTPKLFGF